jgi:hypothetical protein
MPVDSLVTLYWPGLGGCPGGAFLYHQGYQGYHRAAVFMHIDAYDASLPIEEHQ